MFIRNLHTRLVVSFLALILFTLFALGSYILWFFYQHNIAGLKASMLSQAKIVEELIYYDMSGLVPKPRIDEKVKELSSRTDLRVTIVDRTGIVIADSVTTIGEIAFMYSGVTNVTMSSKVTAIGEMAFYACENLSSVTVPGSVTSIGGNAFGGYYGATVRCYEDSYALTYAVENQFNHVILVKKAGHINGDDKISITDARLLLQFLVGKVTLTDEQLEAANVSGGESVTINDARLILQWLVEKIDKFPNREVTVISAVANA
ncbi:MAG: leucine-rich repeat protein [Oscillospiraceae bacterium]|nr:leucine-rich repeat protein [Oscillospiraceae bacterium]